jgi:hypothetical protein
LANLFPGAGHDVGWGRGRQGRKWPPLWHEKHNTADTLAYVAENCFHRFQSIHFSSVPSIFFCLQQTIEADIDFGALNYQRNRLFFPPPVCILPLCPAIISHMATAL